MTSGSRQSARAATVDGRRLVFIGGLHRSGTTPLARCLSTHPAVSGLTGTGVSEDEGHHLQDTLPRVRRLGGMGRFALSERAHQTEDSALNSPATAARLLQAWTPYWDLSRPLLVEKSPSNLVNVRLLQALFPGAAFVMVVRHPVVVSLAMQKWNPSLVARDGRRHASFSTLLRHWVRAHDLLLGDRSSVARLVVVRYERLVLQPREEMSRITELLGLEALPPELLRPGRSSSYAQAWRERRERGRGPRRRLDRLRRTYAHDLARFGYDFDDLDRLGTFPFDAPDPGAT